ncbi:helix-turn-helix transcriptional regulator [Saccharothrix longispora]|uniref:Transcriptional regulator with XRE-family HTH domain n=1 Tax=Saccharothrix longispora TaxID=33920 RepID=A0ABU1Q231_9PSEU|nr:helix-turn-helix transcriptional regulator [Saccharothrix longispora]MDR6596945.1 transcriptional regulator with XRE-family HTH domain [Saccharothrix longispora]
MSLKRYRNLKGVSQAEVGAVIGRVDSRISMVEDGTATLGNDELTCVLDFLGVPDGERATVLELGARARKRLRRSASDPQPYTDTLPGSFQRLADMEADAVTICCYEPGVVPGLLQAPGYIRAVIDSCDGVFWESSQAEIENRFMFRRKRQITTLEADEPKKLEFVFTEEAIDCREDDAGIMREQLEHLLHLDKRHPSITMQVLRLADMRNPASSGGVTVLDFAGSAPDVAFASTSYGPSTYFDGVVDTANLLRAFKKTQELARDHEDTVEFIRRKLEEI